GTHARRCRHGSAARDPSSPEQARQVPQCRHGHGLGPAPGTHEDRHRRARAVRPLIMRALLLAFLVAAAPCAIGQEKPPAVRPEVGKPLQAAIDALKAKRGREALARAREAQEVPNETPYENYLVTRVLGQAAAAAGDNATAASTLENAANSSAAPPAERAQLLAGAASAYYAAKEYAKAAAAATRYFQHGGSDKAIRTVYVNSLYLGGNYGA